MNRNRRIRRSRATPDGGTGPSTPQAAAPPALHRLSLRIWCTTGTGLTKRGSHDERG